MKPKDQTQRVADRIASLLKNGIRLDLPALHFIHASFGLSGPNEIQNALEDEDSGEGQVLVELIFFPDEARQIQVEPVLDAYGLEPSHVKAVHDRVKKTVQSLRVDWPDCSCGFIVEVTDFALEHFLARLHLSKTLDPNLLAAMDRCLPGRANLSARVKLRNSRIDFSARNVLWLKSFFGAYAFFEDAFEPLTAFALGFLEDAPEGDNLYQDLIRLKKRCFFAMEKNAGFEDGLKRFNMETLILQGKRASGMSTQAAREKMGMIDRICLALYGGTEALESAVIHKDLGEVQATFALETLIRVMGR
jgi:hypothetical protein